MPDFNSSLVIIIFFASIGFIGKNLKILDEDLAKRIIRFLFLFPFPVLIFVSFANNKIEQQYIAYPFMAVVLSLTMMSLSFLLSKILSFDKKRTGSLIVASGIASTLFFSLPIITIFYGVEYTRYLFLFDIGNGIICWTLVYYIAQIFGEQKVNLKNSIKRLFQNQMLYALSFGIIFSIFNIKLPEVFLNLNSQIAGLVSPLMLICIGIFIDFNFFKERKNIIHILSASILIVLVSLTVGYILTLIFDVEGVQKEIILLSSVSPAGPASLVIASENKLDTKFSSILIAITIIISFVVSSLLIL